MSNYLFSKTSGSFYHAKVNAGGIPQDAVPVPDADYKALMQAQSEGKEIDSDAQGRPIAIDRAQVPVSVFLVRAKTELSTMRAPMLDALTGIAGRAERSGNDALALEADALAEQLLDITDDPALNAATTYESMQAAGIAAYRRIAGNSSPALASVFKEITGA